MEHIQATFFLGSSNLGYLVASIYCRSGASMAWQTGDGQSIPCISGNLIDKNRMGTVSR